jgi:hypothetical protein
MQTTAAQPATSPALVRHFRRLLIALSRWAAVPDCTTTAPVHYVSIAEATRRATDRSDVTSFTR